LADDDENKETVHWCLAAVSVKLKCGK